MQETCPPGMPHGCLLRIRALYGTLKKTERRVVDFILKNADTMADCGVVEVAEAAACSEGTVVRVSKRLGYDGFLELKRDFARQEPDDSAETAFPSIERNDPPLVILDKVCTTTISGIRDTAKVIAADDSLEVAVKCLLGSKRILFCAVGDAYAVSYEAYLRWMRIGHVALTASDLDEQLLLTAQLEKNDVVFAISHSGRSRNVIQVVKAAQKRKAKVIALTNYPISPLAKLADIVLQTAIFTTYERFEIIAKRIAELTIMESLFISFLFHNEKKHLDCLLESYGLIEPNKV